MKKLSLTQHVLERRKGGNIPPDRLRFVMQHLIDQHSMEDKIDGSYKFRKAGTQAIILKKGNKFRFITFFGPTGYVIDNDDIGIFNCVHQSEEFLKLKAEKKARRALRPKGKETNTGMPLKNLSSANKEKLKRGTFEVQLLDQALQDFAHSKYGQRPYHILVSKHNSYNFIELLKYDGGKVETIHKNVWAGLISE